MPLLPAPHLVCRPLPHFEISDWNSIAAAFAGAGLMQTAFSVRTLGLFERIAPEAMPSYLSGLVIGEELRCRTLARGTEIVLIGAPVLTERFDRALRQCGAQVRHLGEEAVWRGIYAVDRHRRRLRAS